MGPSRRVAPIEGAPQLGYNLVPAFFTFSPGILLRFTRRLRGSAGARSGGGLRSSKPLDDSGAGKVSIEIILHPKAASRDDIANLLKGLGYRPCEHLWDWPKGSLNFQWFEHTDYLSYDGVGATVYKASSDKHQLGDCEWALHTRTRSSASSADQVTKTRQSVQQGLSLAATSIMIGTGKIVIPAASQMDAMPCAWNIPSLHRHFSAHHGRPLCDSAADGELGKA